MPDGLRLALTTLTVARVRGPRTIDRRTAGSAMALAPLVGLLLGLCAAALVLLLRQLSPPSLPQLLPCAAGLALLALLTRGLHLDGLADTADGLASYAPPERARQIMRSPEVGPLGVATVVLVLGVQWAALVTATQSGRSTASLLLAVVTARIAVAAACTRTPAADATGLGAMVAGTVRRGVPLVWAGLAIAGASAFEFFDESTSSTGELAVDVARPAVAVVLALGLARLLRRHCVRRLGGLSGDVLGALVEVTTTVVLVVMALEVPLDLQAGLGSPG